MLVVIKVFRAFYPLIVGQVATDNTTTMYYINKQGGTYSLLLLYLVIHLWEWCYDYHVFPVSIHVSAEDKDIADRLSCMTVQTHEWECNISIFSLI